MSDDLEDSIAAWKALTPAEREARQEAAWEAAREVHRALNHARHLIDDVFDREVFFSRGDPQAGAWDSLEQDLSPIEWNLHLAMDVIERNIPGGVSYDDDDDDDDDDDNTPDESDCQDPVVVGSV